MYQNLKSHLCIRIIFSICLIETSLLMLSSTSFSDITPAPKIFVKTPVFNFKSVNQGTVLKHTFKISNHGNAVLEIKNVKPG